MKIYPEFQIGILNGWIPLALYLIWLIFCVSLYSKESKTWLFSNPKDETKRAWMFIRLFGQLAMMAYIVMMILTPLHINNSVFLLGAVIYSIGYMFEMSALYYLELLPWADRLREDPIVSREALNGWGYF